MGMVETSANTGDGLPEVLRGSEDQDAIGFVRLDRPSLLA